jgi:hypothetical protein
MENKSVFIQKDIKVSDNILSSISKVKEDNNVVFVFEVPILGITRTQPIDKKFFNEICSYNENDSDKVVNKFFGLFRAMLGTDKKAFIFSSQNQLDKYKNNVIHNLVLLGNNTKISYLKNGRFHLENFKPLP